MNNVVLNSNILAAFVDNFLRDDYNDPQPIAPFHRAWWDLYCGPDRYAGLAAPRGHSKSTSLNHAFGLAGALFKQHPFQLKISKTRDVAIEYIAAAKQVMSDNAKIKHQFGFSHFTTDTQDDFVAVMKSGYQFRMKAYGSEQAMRGAIWGTMRPSLIIGDDLEDDELVMNADRREKMMNWFFKALMPIGGRNTKFRVHGTILHAQSLLQALLDSPSWKTLRYEACDADINPESILWPQMFDKARLQGEKDNFARAGNLIGFNMEYRNLALDLTSGYFQPQDFERNVIDDDFEREMDYYVGVDLAISKAARRDYTVMMVGGLDSHGYLNMMDERRGRWDAEEIINEMFAIEDTFKPRTWFVESGSIWKTLKAMLEQEMRKRGIFLNIQPMIPIGNKTERARPFQKRMRSRGVKWNKDTTWFDDHMNELLSFRDADEVNDRIDADAYLGLGLSDQVVPLTEVEEEEFEWAKQEKESVFELGRNPTTGY